MSNRAHLRLVTEATPVPSVEIPRSLQPKSDNQNTPLNSVREVAALAGPGLVAGVGAAIVLHKAYRAAREMVGHDR